MMAIRKACYCVRLRDGTFVALWLHLLGQLNCIRYLILDRWYPNKGEQVIPAFIRNDIVYIGLVIGVFGIFLILAAILQLSTDKNNHPVPILNVIVVFILVDSIFTSYKMIVMNDDIHKLTREYEIRKAYQMNNYHHTRTGRKQFEEIKALNLLIFGAFVGLMFELYSALIIYSYKVEMKRAADQINVPEPPMPHFVAPVQPRVYYVPSAPQAQVPVFTPNYLQNSLTTLVYYNPAPQGDSRPKYNITE